jgi:transcriptional regulator with XRE-family HTH domain
MFEPLSAYIRLRRTQRNLTQERLAKLAGVSRRQLALLEDGKNVSLLFLTKIARALEITDLPVGDLRLRGVSAELTTLVQAADVLTRAKQALHHWSNVTEQIDQATASLDQMIGRALEPAISGQDIERAAERLENITPAERHAAAENLRELARSEPVPRSSRPKATSGAARRQRG